MHSRSVVVLGIVAEVARTAWEIAVEGGEHVVLHSHERIDTVLHDLIILLLAAVHSSLYASVMLSIKGYFCQIHAKDSHRQQFHFSLSISKQHWWA
ncbi:hypothetical protein ASPWEDRAFT_288540 [Aspergillus wentii DTO 134E9]|uniref:Uncharacterized protein n=1 Tax=Aspergillus wentii DTO 134E9 TaxID=1073089 RepID=A0A1L9S3W6_ASPWE|nr:uncharacterized protein ASPWEDRAFT_288540 [Aspergillus wentii DTO 134E9]OJJ41852.1 hypothetical protein ASPWEDRAFT_288540 [Aspergillus wentii DTO 134E9]